MRILYHAMTCHSCGWKWNPRVERPAKCPRCWRNIPDELRTAEKLIPDIRINIPKSAVNE